jgi:hypothetical protein
MYSVNLLGQNGEGTWLLQAGQEFDDKETAVRFYCNPRKYFGPDEFECTELCEESCTGVTHISIEGPDENASRPL